MAGRESSRRHILAAALLLGCLSAHASEVPEPEGYWTGPPKGPVPATISGGTVIDAQQLAQLLDEPGVVIVDVDNAPKRPPELAPGAPWLPLPHQGIPGSVWIPGAGLGEIPSALDAFFRDRLTAATAGDADRAVVFYCHEQCWLSWNAAKRAVNHGYRAVYWFPEGIEGWIAAGLPTVTVEPEAVPGH